MTTPQLSRVGTRSVSRVLSRGVVTAETVVVVPVVLAFALGLVWLVSVAATQVRVVDAAREVARAVARDDAHGAAVALGRRVAPQSATFDIVETAGAVTVTVVAEVEAPGGLFGFLPPLRVDADAVAGTESR